VRRTTALRCALIAAIITSTWVGAPGQASATGTASIVGTMFDDANRNGTRDSGEAVFEGRQMWAFRSDGTWAAGGTTDAAGAYAIHGLEPGQYTVTPATTDWWALRADLVPTTTGSVHPGTSVVASGATTANLGIRRIVRSTTAGAPITSATAANGLLVESYNDVVSAAELRDQLLQTTLFGPEAATTAVRFDLNTGSSATTSMTGGPGTYGDFRGNVWFDYVSWLETEDQVMVHEYGHVWSLYNEFVVQQDGSFATYLDARGLSGDPRLGTGKTWDPRELIAEDYRQLFGSPTARSYPQANRDIPAAVDVPGLADFLRTTYTSGGGPAPDPEPQPSPDPAPALSQPTMNPTPMTSSGTASVSVSEQVTLTVRVMSSNGSTVRTLLQGAARPAGDVAVVWDRLTDAGRKAKAGTYQLVVDAIDGAGQTTRATTTFSVVDPAKPGRR
jgi:hypothetical protein